MIGDLTVSQNLQLTRPTRPRSATGLAEMDLDSSTWTESRSATSPAFLQMLSTWPRRSPSIRSCWCSTRSRRRAADLSDRVFAIMTRWKERNRSVLFALPGWPRSASTATCACVLRDGRGVASFPRQRGRRVPDSCCSCSPKTAPGSATSPGGRPPRRGERAAAGRARPPHRPAGRRRHPSRSPPARVWSSRLKTRARTGCSRSSRGTPGPPAARSSSTAGRCEPGTRTTPSGAGSSWCQQPAAGPAAAAAHPREHRHPAVQRVGR